MTPARSGGGCCPTAWGGPVGRLRAGVERGVRDPAQDRLTGRFGVRGCDQVSFLGRVSRRGSVSERPKEHASKACVGESPPWVQIPPLPPPEGPQPQHLADLGPFVLSRPTDSLRFGVVPGLRRCLGGDHYRASDEPGTRLAAEPGKCPMCPRKRSRRAPAHGPAGLPRHIDVIVRFVPRPLQTQAASPGWVAHPSAGTSAMAVIMHSRRAASVTSLCPLLPHP